MDIKTNMDIQIDGLTHKYPKAHKPVIDNLHVTFSQSKIHGIIGDNGTGKTTLLRLIAGLEPIQKGQVLIDSKKVTLQRVRQEGIVYVASKPTVLTGSVLHNATLALVSRGMTQSEAELRVEPLLKQLDLWRLKDQSSHTLSSGEGQKLSLIRALAISPKVLLVDEPTGNVDGEMTSQAEGLIRKLVEDCGATVLLVSHDLEQIKRLANVSWRLCKGGQIRQDEVIPCCKS